LGKAIRAIIPPPLTEALLPIARRTKRAVPLDVIRLRVTLIDSEPRIWRDIEIGSDATFWDLHVAIQDAMGWKDCHLHVFRVPRPGGRAVDEIGIPQDDFSDNPPEIVPGWDVPLLIYMNRKGDAAEYLYDFGDHWAHSVVVEGRDAVEPGRSYPGCTAGERACPPEDCGGPEGYASLLRILTDPGHEQHREMRDWLAEVQGPFAPEVFSPAGVKFTNAGRRLTRLLKRK